MEICEIAKCEVKCNKNMGKISREKNANAWEDCERGEVHGK